MYEIGRGRMGYCVYNVCVSSGWVAESLLLSKNKFMYYAYQFLFDLIVRFMTVNGN